MSKAFFWKLAWENIKKNRRDYIPYLLTCIGTIAMFYIIYALTFTESIYDFPAAPTVRALLLYGVVVIGIFSVIFLFYTNSFLLKRRKKEFGIFNILGMEKKHITKMLFCETVYLALISFLSGILLGIFLSKLVLLLLFRLMDFHIVFGMDVSFQGIFVSACLFGSIFLLIFLHAVRQIRLSNPIELLKGGQIGEKEPKTKWVTGILGFLLVGTGYVIANTVKSPVEAMFKFFVAVMLVILGTYCIFGAGSILILKALKKNKKFYYKTEHFTIVSGMIYRMKQNAVGLANICILSTMVLVMVSATVGMYVGVEDSINNRYPVSLGVYAKNINPEKGKELVKETDKILEDNHLKKAEEISYSYYPVLTILEEGRIKKETKISDMSSTVQMLFITEEEYCRICKEELNLKNGEVGIYTFRGEKLSGQLRYKEKEWKIVKKVSKIPIPGTYTAILGDVQVVVMTSDDIKEFMADYYEGSENVPGIDYYRGITLKNSTAKTEKMVSEKLGTYFTNAGISAEVEGREENKEFFYQFYGGFLFLGIFLGIIFIMAAVLIIYYKQISEGHDDKERFALMKKVGLSEKEIQKSIRQQTWMVFFFPLACACIHLTAGFGIIKKIFALINLNNTETLVEGTIGTVLGFAVIYIVVYMVTAREYYRIVK